MHIIYKIKNILAFIYLIIKYRVNLKSILFNFKFLPYTKAIKLPILLHKNVVLINCSGNVILDENLYFGMVKIGYPTVSIFNQSEPTNFELKGSIYFCGAATIGHGSKLSIHSNGILQLGDQFTITAHSTIVCTNNIIFGNNNLLSWDILVMDSDLHNIINKNNDIINTPKSIYIGHNNWIGCRTLILKGAELPNNCVVGAKSVINKKLSESNTLYAGAPIKAIKREINWR